LPQGALVHAQVTSDLRDRFTGLGDDPDRALPELLVELAPLLWHGSPYSRCLHDAGGTSIATPEQWPAAIDRIVATTHVLPEVATLEVADAATNHTYEQRHHRARHATTTLAAAEPNPEATLDAAMRAYRALQRRPSALEEPPQPLGPSLT